MSRILKRESKPCSHRVDQSSLNDGRFVELRAFCEKAQDIKIETLVVQDGLPTKITVTGHSRL